MGSYNYAEIIVAVPYKDAVSKMPGLEDFGDVEEWAYENIPKEELDDWIDVESLCIEYWPKEKWLVGISLEQTGSTRAIEDFNGKMMAAAAKIWKLFDMRPSLYLVAFSG